MNKIANLIKNNIAFLIFMFLSVVYLIFTYMHLDHLVLSGDGYAMFGYFKGIFIDHSFENIGMIKYPFGTSLLETPFLLIKLLGLILFNNTDVLNSESGIQIAFNSSVFAAALFYYIISFFIIYLMLKKKFNKSSAIITCFSISFGTMLPFYVIDFASYSHIYGFFIYTLAYYYIDYYESSKHNNLLLDFLLGLIVGISFVIRNTHIIGVGLIYLLYNVNSINSFKDRLRLVFSRRLLGQIIGGSILLVIQLILWRIQAGEFIIYSYAGESFDNYLNPQIGKVLFSDAKGLFIYSPVLIVGVIGMIFFRNINTKYNVSQWFIFAFTTYIISAWGCWWLGVCYGERMFCDILVIFALPLCTVFDYMNKVLVDAYKSKKQLYDIIIIILSYMLILLLIYINFKLLSSARSGNLMLSMDYWSTLYRALLY